MNNSSPRRLRRGSEMVVMRNWSNRASSSLSSNRCLLMPCAAARMTLISLREGCNAVVRRSKRDECPQDCMGPSSSSARQALDDMVGEGLAEGVEIDSGHFHLGFADDAPGFLKFLMM